MTQEESNISFDPNDFLTAFPIDARFQDEDQLFRFEPTKDITAYEVAKLLPAFRAEVPSGALRKYLEHNGLMRHFVQER